MSINATANALNIPFPTIYKWIKKAGKKAEITFLHKLKALKQRSKVKAINIDEAL
jgi:transposase-like protein